MNTFSSRLSIVKELIAYLWAQRLWWLIPMVVVLIGMGVLIIFAQSSTVAPFVYMLF